jgi:hypothetical protein
MKKVSIFILFCFVFITLMVPPVFAAEKYGRIEGRYHPAPDEVVTATGDGYVVVTPKNPSKKDGPKDKSMDSNDVSIQSTKYYSINQVVGHSMGLRKPVTVMELYLIPLLQTLKCQL